MSTRIITAFALAAGFVGGMVSHYLFFPLPAHAEAAPAALEIRAQKFVLVDEQGTVRVFGFRSNGSPDLQVTFAKHNAWERLVSADISSPNWLGVEQKQRISDLK